MSEEALLQELDNSLISPDRYFKDQKLAPYTEGSRLLMLQVRDDSDSAIYFVWSFIYLHILLAEDRKRTIRLAWDKDAFREKLMDWIAEIAPATFYGPIHRYALNELLRDGSLKATAATFRREQADDPAPAHQQADLLAAVAARRDALARAEAADQRAATLQSALNQAQSDL